jgi:hypothetical protein
MVVGLSFLTNSAAQAVPAKTEKELKELLKNSMSENETILEAAGKELLAMPDSTFPIFLKFAQKEKPCLALRGRSSRIRIGSIRA